MSSEATPRLLLVDDEQSITESLAPFLSRSGFDVDVAADGAAALRIIESRHPDIVVSDVVMPVVDGRELLRRLRRAGDTTPVILLTHVGESGERSAALDEGADDYLNKPFDPQELVSRSRAVLRRVAAGAGGLVSAELVEAEGLRLDRPARRVWRDGIEVSLTPKAFQLLEFLMTRPGEVHARERLLSVVWGFDFAAHTRAVDNRVAELRSVLRDDASAPTYIETVPGVGYRFTRSVRRA
ncbi:DNA-binding response regulator, OmpR family, contains REC and winged-helix (wHTH) domain [Microbacterium sp. LKL04]|uniref:response regulator n=1 Tax=Microbacterium sp. LKL04 TaxID=912630 RepID=UPI000875BD14|nr:response regulator transcription factor [Microbacterium sp. LKL04]SCY39919.1 DNA-binding response regulator, OmpR family, contains REC and winged-helix (wHTH) domain [Microbacterium sp. LKL04]